MKARIWSATSAGAATGTWCAEPSMTCSAARGAVSATSSTFAIGVEVSRSPAISRIGVVM